MQKIHYAAILALLITAGCGGSSTGSSVNFESNPLRAFSDGAGVASLSATQGGDSATGYLISPELGLALQEIAATRTVEPFDINDIPIAGTGPNTIIRQGAISEDGIVPNALLITNEDESAAAFLLEEPTFGDSLLMTLGDNVSNLPAAGIASYEGVFGLQDLEFDDGPELGTFIANVNFTNTSRTIEFSGSTASYTLTGTANLQGESFSSKNMTIVDTAFLDPFSATINGDFHGTEGNNMAGVVYSNDNEAVYRGGFVGSR